MVCKNDVCKLRFAFKGNVAMNYYSITNYDTNVVVGRNFEMKSDTYVMTL